MKKKFISLVAIILVLSTFFAIPASAAWDWKWSDVNKNLPNSYAYSFAFVGDTQIIASLDASTEETMSDWGYDVKPHVGKNYLAKMYQWIVDNKEEKKIAHVFGLGDITQNRKTAQAEWKVAKEAWSIMDGKISYSMTRGNHDDMALYTEHLSYDAYLKQFDGYFSSGVNVGRSTYKFLDVAQEKYLLVTLDFGARDDVLKWAEEVIKANPDRRVLITTHGYLQDQSRRTSKAKGDYLSTSDGAYNWGDDIWNKLVKKYENIFMVVCGHTTANPIALRKDTGDNGNTVYEIEFNPQNYDSYKEPTAMVGMMYFSEDGSTFWLEYYSTIKDQYVKLNTTRVKFSEPRFTTEPETTAVSDDTLTIGGEATEPAPTTTSSGCGAVAFIPALPVALGVTAIASRKRKKK